MAATGDKVRVGCGCMLMTVHVAWVAAVLYVAWHFITKYW